MLGVGEDGGGVTGDDSTRGLKTGLARWLAWTPPAPGAAYRPQLDGLRAVAVGGVLWSHFMNPGSMLGSLGVRLFFVLSGYLITGLLLEARDRDGERIHAFYVRRALRLWPAYYVALGLLVLLDVQQIRDVAWWHAFYLSNFLFAMRGDYVPWTTAAWWSLAVEEQFYLLWPAVILLVPRRLLPWVCAAAVPLAASYRLAGELNGWTDQSWLLLPASIDALAGGALVAIWKQADNPTLRWLGPAGWAALPVWLVIAALGLGGAWWEGGVSLIGFMALVAGQAGDGNGRGAHVLGHPVFAAPGRISYGIYLYHIPVWYGLTHLPGGWRLMHPGPALLVLGGTVTLAVAALSWFALEAPLNRLKRRFPFP
jgi:peptidoglycan/LPS O-acetylase OafA/YrhL